MATVIYHGNCQDGFTAAWACWLEHPDWEYVPGKYGEAPPDVTGQDVYLLDFSYKRPVILEMAAKAKSITILDHHKTAEADLVDLPENVSVTFDMEKSGARLAWEYFHPTEFSPNIVGHVEDRDLWRFKNPNTKAYSAALFAEPYTFEAWDYFTLHSMNEILTAGEAILKKQAKDTNELLQNKFRIVVKGQEVWTANLPYTFASDAANLLAEGEPFGSTYYFDGKDYVFSLRSKENGADVSEIAKQFPGGGGHKHSSGFKVPMEEFQKMLINRRA
jgi:oligoribonuclease NrnB/cAMP/cGMP phosphodiesterase (DHH superfamily)